MKTLSEIRKSFDKNQSERLKALFLNDNKDYSPFPKGATSSIERDTTPIGANPFMEIVR